MPDLQQRVDAFKESQQTFGRMIHDWLIGFGFEDSSAILMKGVIIVLGIFILSYIVFLISRRIIVQILHEIAKRTETTWDDIMVERRVFHRLAYLAPAILIHSLMPSMLVNYETWTLLLQGALKIYMVLIIIIVLDAFFSSMIEIYQNYEISKFKPIKGYIQIMKIIIYLISESLLFRF